MSLRRMLIRSVLPFAWRASRTRTALGLQRFAITEVDSAWQSLQALHGAENPRLRAKLFQHALEEIHHGALFRGLCVAYSDAPPAMPTTERQALYRSEHGAAGLIPFFAYEFVGERDVRDEFTTYAAAAPYDDIKQLFERAKLDEKGHAIYTERALDELTDARPWHRRFALVRAVGTRRYEAWLRLSKHIGEVPPAILMSALYFLFGALLQPSCRKRLATSYAHENPRPVAPAATNSLAV